MSEKATLPPFLRKLLLIEICSRIDITRYCTMRLGVYLQIGMRDFYSGFCPYCWKKGYHVNNKTGSCFCAACSKKSDFIELLGDKKGLDFSGTLAFLNDLLEEVEKQQVTYSGGAPC